MTERPKALAADLDRKRREFDFWLGDWDLRWAPDGAGRNRITAVLDGHVVLEEFDGTPSIALRGMSLSTVSPETGAWHQAWVDSQGNFLDFRGGFRSGEMVLERDGVVAGNPVRQRMLWTNIGAQRLTWRWQRSSDHGASWTTLWEIEYVRRSGAAS